MEQFRGEVTSPAVLVEGNLFGLDAVYWLSLEISSREESLCCFTAASVRWAVAGVDLATPLEILEEVLQVPRCG